MPNHVCVRIVFIYPQKKIQGEIDSEIASISAFPSIKDRPQMPYTEAAINETLRYSCLLPLSVPHANMEAAEINGYHIPKRSTILLNVKIHFDPKRWVNPEEFDPGRFLSSDAKHVTNQDAFLPFSIGIYFYIFMITCFHLPYI